VINDLSHVPNKPGVYQFFDENKIIYIGKGKDLKKRVSSYFTRAIKDRKTEQIKKSALRVETIATHTEAEALILEQQLIKEHKPKFNILLRDDKTYPYIYFDLGHKFPSIKLKRSKQAINACYFGPYTSAKLVREQIRSLQKIFKLRNCSDSTFSNRSRPCIEFQMKRCSAPCVNYISSSNYLQEIDRAKLYLTSEKKQLKKVFHRKMSFHADKLEFEEAAEFKKRIAILKHLEAESKISTIPITLDILHFSLDNKQIGVALLAIRDGKLQSTRTCYFKDIYQKDDIEELIQSIVIQHYRSINQLPKKILILNKILTSNLIEEALYKKFLRRVRIIFTASGHVKSFAEIAKLNSKQAIHNYSAKPPLYEEHFKELSRVFKISYSNISLECLDISHHSGSKPKAGLAHFNIYGPQKKYYRTYSIPNSFGGNDIASIKFAVEKRLQLKNAPPSILLIDGGILQLNAALLAKNNSRTIILSIKKGSKRKSLTETIYSKEGNEDININSRLFSLLIKARDEAHRFAIRANRIAKSKSIKSSKLDTILGIGPHRKMLLLKEFKSIDAIIDAPPGELIKFKGITDKVIESIKALKE